jgi:hypothetical protein
MAIVQESIVIYILIMGNFATFEIRFSTDIFRLDSILTKVLFFLNIC